MQHGSLRRGLQRTRNVSANMNGKLGSSPGTAHRMRIEDLFEPSPFPNKGSVCREPTEQDRQCRQKKFHVGATLQEHGACHTHLIAVRMGGRVVFRKSFAKFQSLPKRTGLFWSCRRHADSSTWIQPCISPTEPGTGLYHRQGWKNNINWTLTVLEQVWDGRKEIPPVWG